MVSARTTLLLVIGALAIGTVIGSQVCARPAHGQLPLTPRAMTQYDLVNAAYGKQIERIWTYLYEGYITRPGHEKDEDEKFRRGLRIARIARERAQAIIFDEPWQVVTPIPGEPPSPSSMRKPDPTFIPSE